MNTRKSWIRSDTKFTKNKRRFTVIHAVYHLYTWFASGFRFPYQPCIQWHQQYHGGRILHRRTFHYVYRVPTVLEKSLNFGFSLKSPWKWICPWKVLEFRGPSLKFQLVVLDFLFCVFWTESLNGYSKLRGTRANFPPKIWLASLAEAYKFNIFPVSFLHI